MQWVSGEVVCHHHRLHFEGHFHHGCCGGSRGQHRASCPWEGTHHVHNKSHNNQPRCCKGGECIGTMGGVVGGGGVSRCQWRYSKGRRHCDEGSGISLVECAYVRGWIVEPKKHNNQPSWQWRCNGDERGLGWTMRWPGAITSWKWCKSYLLQI